MQQPFVDLGRNRAGAGCHWQERAETQRSQMSLRRFRISPAFPVFSETGTHTAHRQFQTARRNQLPLFLSRTRKKTPWRCRLFFYWKSRGGLGLCPLKRLAVRCIHLQCRGLGSARRRLTASRLKGARKSGFVGKLAGTKRKGRS